MSVWQTDTSVCGAWQRHTVSAGPGSGGLAGYGLKQIASKWADLTTQLSSIWNTQAAVISDCMGLGNQVEVSRTEKGVQGRLKAQVFVAPSDSDDRLSFLRVCKMFHLHLKVRKKRKENKRRKDLRNPQRYKLWAFSYPSFFLFSFFSFIFFPDSSWLCLIQPPCPWFSLIYFLSWKITLILLSSACCLPSSPAYPSAVSQHIHCPPSA